MSWLPLALVIALALSGYHVLIKMASPHVSDVLGAVVLQAVAVALGGGLLLIMAARGDAPEATGRGLALAAGAGLCVGAAEILSFVLFSGDLPASRGVPVIVGATVLMSALLGAVALREHLSPPQWAGVALIAVGVLLLAR